MSRKILLISALALALPGAMPTANAMIVEETFTGMIGSGSDKSDFFGGGSLAGDPFSATYVFDTSLDSGSTSPLLSASITVNGTTVDFSGAFLANGGGLTQALIFQAGRDQLGLLPMSVNYSVETTVTPLPATLPLFATGLGALGLFGWRRKRRLRLQASSAAPGEFIGACVPAIFGGKMTPTCGYAGSLRFCAIPPQ